MQKSDRADSRVHRPTTAARFNRRPGAIQPDVADFRLARSRAVINFPARHQTATDAAPQRQIKNRIATNASAVERLAESSHVAVVVNESGRAGQLLKPVSQIEIRPARDLMGAADFPCPPIHRPAETDTHRFHRVLPAQFSNRLLDLLANPNRTPGRLDRELAAFVNCPAPVAKDELQLGAADFYAESAQMRTES